MFINRDWSKSELDDFYENVSPQMGLYDGATPVWHDNKIVGWNIKPMYE